MLGKGLESLIPKKIDASANQTIDSPSEFKAAEIQDKTQITHKTERKSHIHDSVFLIEVDNIKPNPHQPRKHFDEESLKELADSIREFGILQPIVVSKIEKETDYGADVEYQLIAGERRLMAAKMLGFERVPAIVKKISKKSEGLEMAVVENIQRSDLNPVETARAYAKLQEEFGLTQREIATRVGKSRETVANTMRLLNLPTEIQDALAKNQLNESHARMLLMIENPQRQMGLFMDLISNKMSVRQLKSKIAGRPAAGNALSVDPEAKILEEELQILLNTKVKVDKNKEGAKVTIVFYSPEEINGFIQKIKPRTKEGY